MWSRSLTTLVALLMVLPLACSDDAVASYASEVASITEDMTRSTFEALPPGAAPTREQVEEVVQARRRAAERLSALDAPRELQLEHTALVTALERFVTESEDFLSAGAGLTAQEFHQALLAATHLDDLAGRVGAACRAFERRAAAVDRPVALAC